LFEVTTAAVQQSQPQQEIFRLAQITAFLPFTDGGSLREAVEDDLAASLMAIHHFNNPQLSPHLTPQDLEGCNIKLTAEFFDTQYSPIDSTRLFTNILQRQHTLQLPAPSAVIGAYRSAVTSPLAILTGVNDIPQVSYGSTSTDFDVKEQYPLFGRTIHSSTGEAQVALQLYKSLLHASHVGVLFVTDAYGSALQKAFQDAASEENIITDSVAFSYSADLNSNEIRNAVTSLKNTDFRFFYVIAFEAHYAPIMTAAYEEGLVGDDFFWLFNGLDAAVFHRDAVFEPGSPLAEATNGVGLLTVNGGLHTEIRYPNQESVPEPKDDPQSSYEKFRTAWRDTISDPTLEAYFRSRIPPSVTQRHDFDPGFEFGLEATAYTPFLYDAITSVGLSYCRAARRGEFNGAHVFQEFSNLDFDGATGRVKISNETGTRDFRTEVFTLVNVQKADQLDENGKVVYKLVPTNFFRDGWEPVPVEGQVFTYAGGSTETPKSLPDPDVNNNYIGDTGRAVGYTLMGIVVFLSLASFVWLFCLRNERVVRSSQPLFLFMIALGALVMASSIVPLSLEEPVSLQGLNIACMSAPWLYMTGAVIAFASLLAKTRGVHQAYTNPDLDFIHVTSFDIICTFTLLYILNLAVMLTWTFLSPLKWQRIYRDSTDIFDRFVESYGTCSNSDALPFVVVILILNISILIVANWWAYQARNIETEYHESRYIGISMASILQAWCMGIPILIVVWDNPQAKFFVEAGIIFVTALAVLLLVFIPKFLAIRTDRQKAVEETKRLAYTNFTARSKQHQFAEDEEGSKPQRKIDSKSSSKTVGGEDGPNVSGDNTAVPAGTEQVNNTATEDSSDGSAAKPQSDVSGPVTETDVAGKANESVNDKSLNSRPSLQPIQPTPQSQEQQEEGRNEEDNSAGAEPSSRFAGLRRSSFANSFRRSIKFTDGIPGLDGTSAVEGIRVTHNPRSARNLQVSGGREYSRAQLQHLEDMRQKHQDVDDDDFDDYDDDDDDDMINDDLRDEQVAAEAGDARHLSQ